VNPDRPLHSVSVAAVVIDDDGRCLLVRRRDNGKWEPPGGILERAEGIEDGLRREIWEETGLNIEPGPLTGVYKNCRQGIVALVFRGTMIGGTVATNDETAELRWVTREEVPALVDEVYAIRILDAHGDAGPHVRDHDGAHVTHTMTTAEAADTFQDSRSTDRGAPAALGAPLPDGTWN